MQLGIVGPIGSYDIGDWALLQSNIDSFKNKFDFVLFTYDKWKTLEAVNRLGYHDHVKEIVDISNLSLINEDISSDVSILIDHLYWGNGHSIATNNISGGLDEIDHLLVTGGAYFNHAWGDNFLPISSLIRLAHSNGVDVTISGINFGPCNKIEQTYLTDALEGVDTISLRSDNRSEIKFAEEVGADDIRLLGDNASFLSTTANIKVESEYVVVNLHPSYVFSNNIIFEKMREILTTLAENGWKIVFLPMHYNPNRDLKSGQKVTIQLDRDNYRIVNVLENPDPKGLKGVVKNASLVMSSRLHPIIFALGEQTEILPILTMKEPYSSVYRRKFSGILGVFNLPKEQYMTPQELSIELVEDIIDKRKRGYCSDQTVVEELSEKQSKFDQDLIREIV
jgi:polysaccharide pyruvyl transferase WcaK-like protein